MLFTVYVSVSVCFLLYVCRWVYVFYCVCVGECMLFTVYVLVSVCFLLCECMGVYGFYVCECSWKECIVCVYRMSVFVLRRVGGEGNIDVTCLHFYCGHAVKLDEKCYIFMFLSLNMFLPEQKRSFISFFFLSIVKEYWLGYSWQLSYSVHHSREI